MKEDKEAQGVLFDPIKHIYTDPKTDRRLPSVTQVVHDVSGSEHFAEPWHLQRGSMIHRAVTLYLGERLDESTVDPRIRGRVNSAIRAIKELNIQPTLIEFRMKHKLYGFAGTPDLLAGNTLIDWKSSKMKETGPQMGGYVLLLEAHGYKVKTCLEIILEDDRYIIHEHKTAPNRAIFLAALTVYKWKHST